MKRSSLVLQSLKRSYLSGFSILVALSVLWGGLGISLEKSSCVLSQSWSKHFSQTTLIALPPEASRASVQALFQSLHAVQGVSDLQILSPSDTQKLLEKWGTSWPQPAPYTLILQNALHDDTLKITVKKLSPDSLFVSPPSQEESSFSLIKSYKAITYTISLFFIISALFVFLISLSLSLRHSYQRHSSQLRILCQLGLPSHRLSCPIACQFSFACFIGAGIGLLAVFAINHEAIEATASLFHSTYFNLSFLESLSYRLFLSSIFLILPLITLIISWIFYRRALHLLS